MSTVAELRRLVREYNETVGNEKKLKGYSTANKTKLQELLSTVGVTPNSSYLLPAETSVSIKTEYKMRANSIKHLGLWLPLVRDDIGIPRIKFQKRDGMLLLDAEIEVTFVSKLSIEELCASLTQVENGYVMSESLTIVTE